MNYPEVNNTNKQNFLDFQVGDLTFIDTNLTNYQSLILETNNNNVVLIDSQKNGIEQITEVLERYSNLDSISIFSHGDIGSIQLGNTYLSNENLSSYQDNLATWSNALSEYGDLLLYGCNVGDTLTGVNFVNRVADITGADVAASNNLTGNFKLGGDWTLEVETGIVERATVNLAKYNGVLGLNFNFTYGTNVTTVQKTSVELAGQLWSEYLADNVTLNIHVETASNNDLPEGVIGAALPFFHLGENYSNVRHAFAQDVTSSIDQVAINNLETGNTWSTTTDWLNTSQTVNIDQVALTKANAKALGIISAHDQSLDGIITLNDLIGTNVGWQYDYLAGSVGISKLDFTSVATHEIGHILGFVSIADGMTNTTPDNNMVIDGATTMDLFRRISYADQSKITPRTIDQAYTRFSVDRGLTNMGYLANGLHYGNDGNIIDNFQASHWYRNSTSQSWTHGMMDPYLPLNTRRAIQTQDIQFMDAIGWDVKHSQQQWIDRSGLKDVAVSIAQTKDNVNRNIEIGAELQDWRWARRGSASTLRQNGNITQFLAQEGFFSVGSFRESFDFGSVNSAKDNNVIVVNNQISQDLGKNNDSDLVNDFEFVSQANVPHIAGKNEEINYEQMLALVTEELSNDQLSQLSLEDLAQLIEQQLGEAIV